MGAEISACILRTGSFLKRYSSEYCFTMESNLTSPPPENRVTNALLLYAEQEAQLKISNPAGHAVDRQGLALKYEFYSSIVQTYKKGLTLEEKFSLAYVRHEMGKIKARLQPTVLRRVLYNRPVNAVRNFMNGYNIWYSRLNHEMQSIQKDILLAHNLETLKAGLKAGGFSLNMDNVLERMLKQNFPSFHIRYTDPLHQKNTDFTIHFTKIPGADLYYLQKFDAVCRPSLQSVLKNDPGTVRKTFSLDDKIVFSATEAASLVNGKAVCKMVDGKEQWLSLNITKGYNQENEYNQVKFNVYRVLEQLPILEMTDPTKAIRLIESLKTGVNKEITLQLHSHRVKAVIAAAPHQKTVLLTDKNGQYLDMDRLMKNSMPDMTRKLSVVSQGQGEDMVIDLNKRRNGIKR